jgi:hypothetical protein
LVVEDPHPVDERSGRRGDGQCHACQSEVEAGGCVCV